MKDLKRRIADESLAMIATHYNTDVKTVSLAIASGNEKLKNEVLELCEKTLEAIYA